MPGHDHSRHGHGAPTSRDSSFWNSRAFLVFLGFAAIALVLLWEEHSAHILGLIPRLFLLACPLMHVFMHGGHGGQGGHCIGGVDSNVPLRRSSGTWNPSKGDKS